MASERWLILPTEGSRDTLGKRYLMANFCASQCKQTPQICEKSSGYIFDDIEDAVLFKITFGGTLRRKK